MWTASMEASRRTSRKSVVVFGMAKPAASRSAVCAFRPTTAAASTDSTRRTASRCTRPIKPVPKIAVLIAFIRVPSGPPHSCRLFAHHDLVEKVCCLRQTFTGREQAVFMLDRYNVVVAEHAECGDELAPKLNSMAIAAGAEDPRAVAFVGVRFGVKDAGAHHVCWVQLGTLCMHVKDRVT